jgi:DNA-binding NarL/FixJ family response regulator
MIRILLFEDNLNYRTSLLRRIEHTDGMFVAATLENGAKAAWHVKEHQPDVVLMDIEMPTVTGLEALHAIKQAHPDTPVMMNTQFEDDHSLFMALCAGADSYAVKTEPFARLKTAIEDVAQGYGFFSSRIARKVSRLFQDIHKVDVEEYVFLT